MGRFTNRHAGVLGWAVVLGGLASPGLGYIVTTTFDNGLEGWTNTGRTDMSMNGNPGACLDGPLVDVFGISVRNTTNPAFLGDYTHRGGPVTLSLDIRTDSFTFFGTEVSRTLIAEFVDNTPGSGGLPYVSVWVPIGTIRASGGQWSTYATPAFDPTGSSLPNGWGGYGMEDAFGNPMLPTDRTFSSVMASVDEVRFTTFIPGFFYGFSNAQMGVDNIRLNVAPTPGALVLLGASGLLSRRRSRR